MGLVVSNQKGKFKPHKEKPNSKVNIKTSDGVTMTDESPDKKTNKLDSDMDVESDNNNAEKLPEVNIKIPEGKIDHDTTSSADNTVHSHEKEGEVENGNSDKRKRQNQEEDIPAIVNSVNGNKHKVTTDDCNNSPTCLTSNERDVKQASGSDVKPGQGKKRETDDVCDESGKVGANGTSGDVTEAKQIEHSSENKENNTGKTESDLTSTASPAGASNSDNGHAQSSQPDNSGVMGIAHSSQPNNSNVIGNAHTSPSDNSGVMGKPQPLVPDNSCVMGNAQSSPLDNSSVMGNAHTSPSDNSGVKGNANISPPDNSGGKGNASSSPSDNSGVKENAQFSPSDNSGVKGNAQFSPPNSSGVKGNANTSPPDNSGVKGNANTSPPDNCGVKGNAMPTTTDSSKNTDTSKDGETGRKSTDSKNKNIYAASRTDEHKQTTTEYYLNENVRFYRNEIYSKPFPGAKIEEMLQWKGDYTKLERSHSYIQWLFPIPESRGMNYSAQPLQDHEAQIISEDETLRNRVLEAFRMMLHFYGMQLDLSTQTIQRGENWKERYENLNRSLHNHFRITRIIKALGELGWKHLQVPWLEFMIHEAATNKVLPKLNDQSTMCHFIDALKDDEDKGKMYHYLADLNDPSHKTVDKANERDGDKNKATEDNVNGSEENENAKKAEENGNKTLGTNKADTGNENKSVTDNNGGGSTVNAKECDVMNDTEKRFEKNENHHIVEKGDRDHQAVNKETNDKCNTKDIENDSNEQEVNMGAGNVNQSGKETVKTNNSTTENEIVKEDCKNDCVANPELTTDNSGEVKDAKEDEGAGNGRKDSAVENSDLKRKQKEENGGKNDKYGSEDRSEGGKAIEGTVANIDNKTDPYNTKQETIKESSSERNVQMITQV